MKEIESRRRGEDSGASIDIIPLMDVIFLLLCFFILLTLNMVYQRGMTVNLADAKTGLKPEKTVKKVTVTVRENGRFYLREESFDEASITARLSDLKQQYSNLTVYVNADRNARHHQIVSVMDAIRSAAIEDVIFSVQPDS